jgi:hypothetical protein
MERGQQRTDEKRWSSYWAVITLCTDRLLFRCPESGREHLTLAPAGCNKNAAG